MTDRTRRVDLEERIAVRLCAHDRFGADVAAAARAVYYDELLAGSLREPRSHELRDDVGRATEAAKAALALPH